jgi:hypothetical protein
MPRWNVNVQIFDCDEADVLRRLFSLGSMTNQLKMNEENKLKAFWCALRR